MRLKPSLGLGAVLAVLVSLVSLGGVPVSDAGGQESSATGSDTLRTCLATNRRLDAVLVVDETRSLQRTDPNRERVGAVQAVIDAVALAASQSSAVSTAEPVTVSLLVAGFGRAFDPAPQGWIDVNPSSIPELRNIAEGFRDRDQVVGTDYFVALRGAQDALDQRAVDSNTTTPACRLVVLFSDGEYELGDQPPGASVDYAPELDLSDRDQRVEAVRVGFEQMCADGGLLDRMRSSRPPTVIMGLGLQLGSRAPELLELPIPSDAFFTAIATGSGPGGVTCGNPDSAAFGVVTTADEIPDLAVGLFCALNGCAPPPNGDSNQPVTLAVDPGVVGLVVQGAGPPGYSFSITDPSGTTVVVPAGVAGSTPGLAGEVVVEPQSDQFSVARIDLPAGGKSAIGDWTVGAVIGDQPAGSSVALGVSRQSGLSLESTDALRLTIGEPASISAQLRVLGGGDLSVAELDGSYEVTADLLEPGTLKIVTEVDAGIDALTGAVTLELKEVPSTDLTNLFLEARLTGAYSDGQQRQPAILARSVALLRGGLPLVSSPSTGVRLSGVRGGSDDLTARGGVPVAADGDIAGRACVVGYEQSGPAEAAPAVLVGAPDSCVDLAPGASNDLPIALGLDEVTSGEYVGNILIELTAPNDTLIEPAQVRVPVSFAGYAPVCTGVLVGTITGILALVALVVVLLLYVLARLAARFPRDGKNVSFAAVAVSVIGEEVYRPGGNFFSLEPGDFAGLVTPMTVDGQTLVLGDTGVEVTPRPRWFGMPQAILHLNAPAVVGCEDGVAQRSPFSRTGRIRHELAGSWAFEIHQVSAGEGGNSADRQPAATGVLWVLRDVWANSSSVVELTEQARRGLTGPGVKAAIRRLAAESNESSDEPPTTGIGRWLHRKRPASPEATPEDFPKTLPTPRRL